MQYKPGVNASVISIEHSHFIRFQPNSHSWPEHKNIPQNRDTFKLLTVKLSHPVTEIYLSS